MSEPTTTSAAASADSAARPHKFELFIDNIKYETTDSVLTGAQLKALAAIPPANHLFLDEPGHGDDRQILDNEPVELKSGMHFYDVPIGNLGAR